MADDDERFFTDKNENVDWPLVFSKRDGGLLDKLLEADRSNDEKALDALVEETEALYDKLSTQKIDKDDTNANVDNLVYLVQMMQSIMEVREDCLTFMSVLLCSKQSLMRMQFILSADQELQACKCRRIAQGPESKGTSAFLQLICIQKKVVDGSFLCQSVNFPW
jgi:hypothetical protein